MSKHTHNIIVGCTVFAGLLLLGLGSADRVVASLVQQSHQGAMVERAAEPGETMLKPAAWQYREPAGVGTELAVGMLLVLLALMLHGLFVLRRRSTQRRSASSTPRWLHILHVQITKW